MKRKRAEMDGLEGKPPTVGGAEAIMGDEEDHGPHSWLYVPDMSSQTGWASHRVPERQERPVERQPMGFRR